MQKIINSKLAEFDVCSPLRLLILQVPLFSEFFLTSLIFLVILARTLSMSISLLTHSFNSSLLTFSLTEDLKTQTASKPIYIAR